MSKKIILMMAVIMSSCICNLYAQALKELGIEEMFRLADENNREIIISRIDAEQAKLTVKTVKSTRLPSLDANLSFSYLGDGKVIDRDFSHTTNAPIPHFGNSFSVEASQVVYAGGAISGSINIAKLQEQISHLALNSNIQEIRFLLVGYYLELFKLINQREIYLKNIEQAEKLLSEIRVKQAEGVALKNDITRYELQLKTLEQLLITTNNNISVINFEIVVALGLPKGTIIIPDSKILENNIPVLTEGEWLSTAMDSQPLLKQSELQININKQQEKITKAERMPQVALVAGNYFNGPITIEIPAIDKNFNYWYVGIGAKFNIASLYKTNHKIQNAKHSIKKAEENFELMKEHVEVNIQASYTNLIESFAQLTTQEKSLELATENYEVINNRYLNELSLITDMIDASTQKLSAELLLVNARINTIYNYYKLMKMAGMLN